MKKIIKLLINFCFMVNLITNDSSIVFSLDNDNCYFKLNNMPFGLISNIGYYALNNNNFVLHWTYLRS